MRVVKNKCAAPFAEAEFDIRWGIGIDQPADLLDMAVAKGVLEKSGAHLMLNGKSIGQGKEKSRDALLTSPELDLVRSCANDACGWLFIDTSRKHNRKWCEMGVCGNRAKARRFYERKKERR